MGLCFAGPIKNRPDGRLLLFLAEFNLLDFNVFAGTANDCLLAAVAFTDWLLEVLGTFGGDNHTRLLDFTRKTAQQALSRFLRVFLGNLYHIRSIVP